tara:strand:- start:46 stop:228 length:183 start_codon:yes stop_codon:yes gene_type:complete
MKKICLSCVGVTASRIAKAIADLPPVREFGYDSKLEAKKEKKRVRELVLRKRRLDKMKVT